MKKKLIITGIFVLFMGLIAGIFCYYIQWKQARREQIEEVILQIDYKQQNQSFGMGAKVWYSGYQGYDEIKETELYVRLAAYNSWNCQQNNGKENLTLADFKDYLSSEHNEDGSLRISLRPEKIQDYIDWYYDGGDGEIEEYRNELENILLDFQGNNPEIIVKPTRNMTTEQLQEIINKYNDPSYEINAEIMGEQE